MSRDNVKRTCAILVLAAAAGSAYGLSGRLCPTRDHCVCPYTHAAMPTGGCPYLAGHKLARGV